MPPSIEKIRYIAVYGTIAILIAAAAFIIIEYPEVLNGNNGPSLHILTVHWVEGRNESGTSDVNLSIIIDIKNAGTSNESKILVCSVTYQNGADSFLTFSNRTSVTLTPGETRTYYPVVILPDSAKSVSWTLKTVFE
jgi:hypothetical protein